ncbi:TetR/AcrR family transcriptional regulator [Rhizorhapis sp. SPR117]|uniref:TetR/AcrR family transcriptional regulator n=1 Tax=Rhizorhapis sp. SPR117 TaxID=2912611 RepID=UPI001F3FDD6A|nr:TetR/AcrR family transcriptional regulator [Rhizorhapis sp. SPR117]
MHPAKTSRPPGERARLRRNHLLEIARNLFIEQGFHQTGIAQIATASGIAVGQMYRDFESKEAIIAAICEADVEAWLEEKALADAVAARDLPAIRGWLERFGTRNQPEDRCRLVAEIIAEAGRNPRVADIYRGVDARVRQSLSAALAALSPEGISAKHVAVVAEYILTFGAGGICRRITHPQQCAEQIDRFVDAAIFNDLEHLLQEASISSAPERASTATQAP